MVISGGNGALPVEMHSHWKSTRSGAFPPEISMRNIVYSGGNVPLPVEECISTGSGTFPLEDIMQNIDFSSGGDEFPPEKSMFENSLIFAQAIRFYAHAPSSVI